MSADEVASGLAKLVESASSLPATEEGEPWLTPPLPASHAEAGPVVHELVYAFLLWEGSSTDAARAARRIADELADLNELRACLPREVASLLGARFPMVTERAERLRASLHEVFRREQALSLEQLREMPKREARVYLESLPGMVPFVAARVVLLALGAHAFPLDRRLQSLLAAEGVIEGVDLTGDAGRLERAVRAGEAEPAYIALERLAARAPRPRGRRSASGGRTRTRAAGKADPKAAAGRRRRTG